MSKLMIEIDGVRFEVSLESEAPKTVGMVKQTRSIGTSVGHAMWSGPLLLIRFPDAATLPRENITTFMAPGTVVVHPEHQELGIAYAPTQFKEPTGAVYVTKLGQIKDNLDELALIGSRCHRSGMLSVKVEAM